MTRFGVDTAELVLLARTIREGALEAEAATGDRHGLDRPIAALAHPRLTASLAGFMDRWGSALEMLIGDSRRLADGLELLAGVYEDVEVAARSGFVDDVVASAGNVRPLPFQPMTRSQP